MAKILSQEEVDALLNSFLEEEKGGKESVATIRPKKSPKREEKKGTIYNFRRPDRISKDQIRSIHYLHDRFARNFSSSLSAYLRALVEVNLVSVEQLTYAEFVLSLPDPTFFNAISMSPLEIGAIIEVSPSIVFPVIDKLLGGSGAPHEGPSRAITEIEVKLMTGVLNLMLRDLKEAWKQIIELDMRITAQETSPQLIQIVAPNEVVVLIVFEIKMGASSGMVNFCIPSIVLEPIAQKFSQDWYTGRRKYSEDEIYRIRDILKEALFEVYGEIKGKPLTLEEIMNLERGDILMIEKKDFLNPLIVISGKPKFVGALFVQDERKALKIKSIIKRFKNE